MCKDLNAEPLPRLRPHPPPVSPRQFRRLKRKCGRAPGCFWRRRQAAAAARTRGARKKIGTSCRWATTARSSAGQCPPARARTCSAFPACRGRAGAGAGVAPTVDKAAARARARASAGCTPRSRGRSRERPNRQKPSRWCCSVAPTARPCSSRPRSSRTLTVPTPPTAVDTSLNTTPAHWPQLAHRPRGARG